VDFARGRRHESKIDAEHSDNPQTQNTGVDDTDVDERQGAEDKTC